jgi:hypothetical protein
MFNSVGLPLYLCLDGFVYVLDGFGLPCGGIVSVDSRGCHLVVLLDGEGALHSSGLLFGMRYTLVGYMAPCLFLLSLGWVIGFLRDCMYDLLLSAAPHSRRKLSSLSGA